MPLAFYALLGSVLVLGQTASPTHGPPLTLRQVERAIDRAFVAELAGDFEGGRNALSALLEAPPLPEEASARARANAWMASARAREEAFGRLGRTIRAYAQAYPTLRDFGPRRAELFWGRAVRDLPALKGRSEEAPSVYVRFERLRRVEAAPVLDRLRRRFSAAGLDVVVQDDATGAYELRVNLDATETVAREARVRVTAEGSFLLRARGAPEPLASYARRRSVVRRKEAAARAFALRRLVDDLSWAAIFRLRAALLGSASPDHP